MTEKPNETPKSEPKPKPSKPVLLHLKVPVNGIVAGRIVSADPALAETLRKAEQATIATKKQIGLAGGQIPHLTA